ncbi:MAG: FkbM family methyltransferase, partial [Candidatus Parvarchaeota archaeon]
GRDVLDIRASIGDSAIYFALRGAKHVYAFEVLPSTYRIAVANVRNNGLEDRITVFNAGLGRQRTIYLPEDYYSDGGFSLKQGVEGNLPVQIKSLNQVVEELNIDSAVMKIDCEGCEYDVFDLESSEALNVFTHIIGEYHYGFVQLKKVLETKGFSFSFSKPEPFYSPLNNPPYCYTGIFRAERTGE